MIDAGYLIGAAAFIAVVSVAAFVGFIRFIARLEVNKALKAYVVGQVLVPRSANGQFKKRK